MATCSRHLRAGGRHFLGVVLTIADSMVCVRVSYVVCYMLCTVMEQVLYPTFVCCGIFLRKV